jgi:ferredoxin/flavodoxin---NADP+ reductase
VLRESVLITGSELRVAVVGSGPAGFYAAGHLLARSVRPVTVDVFDRLPTPWGLVRSGVAPDHPKLKTVSAVFERTAADPRFRFFGNVCIGTDVTREDLLARYHAVIYAVGAEGDRRLAIPGEDLPGSHSAVEFVGWYNGHPDFADRAFDLSCERAVVIGNGNVALDLARMLSLSKDELARTDVADHALGSLATSAVRETVVVGRRGPAQAAFTSPELNELTRLGSVQLEMHGKETLARADYAAGGLDAGDAGAVGDAHDLSANDAGEVLRKLEILRGFAHSGGGAPRLAGGKGVRVIQFRFLWSPVEIRGDGKVEETVLQRNELYQEGGAVRARPVGEHETITTGLVLRAVGYTASVPNGLASDETSGVIAHRGGRVLSPSGGPMRGEYCAGWIKRGPQGVIGTNKRDALETVTALLEDLDAGRLSEPAEAGPGSVDELLAARGVRVVDQGSWLRIDTHERERGGSAGRPRVKACRWDELLSLAGS